MSSSIDTLEPQTITNPFPGLRPFRVDESKLFFGREAQVNHIVEQIQDKGFIAIVGASGVGKSSFMSCGVLSDILEKKDTNEDEWNIVSISPGKNPSLNLARGLYNSITRSSEQSNETEASRVKEIESLQKIISDNPEGLFQILNENKADRQQKHLLFIDQFEEVFRFPPEDIDANASVKALIDLMASSVRQEEIPIYIVIAIRADFIGDCAKFPELTKAINDSQYLIPQLTRQQKQTAIEGPIRYMGGDIDSDLVDKILNEVGDNADQLPIMQHALMRTWEYWNVNQSHSKKISISDYEAIGEISSALSQHAREAYREIKGVVGRDLCKRIFKCITEKGEDGRGVRRPTTLKDISNIVGASQDDVSKIIKHFTNPSRSLLMPPKSTFEEDTMIDISHESLMRNWVELSEWVDEEAESVKLYLRLATAASLHQEGKARLWTPPDLLLAVEWEREQSPTQDWGLRYHTAYSRTMLFLEHSINDFERRKRINEKKQKRKINRARRFSLIMIFICFIAGMAVFFATEEKEKADLAKQEAVASAEYAEEQAENAAQQAEIAAKQARIAYKQTKIAENQAQIAEEQTIVANKAEEAAYMLRLLSLSKSMAIKSLQIDSSHTEGKVAMQAYYMSSTNGGLKADPDIYNGLYNAIKALIPDGKNRFSLNYHNQNVRNLISDGYQNLYSSGSDGKIMKWIMPHNTLDTVITIHDPEKVKINKSLALNSSGNQLACGGLFQHIEIYDTQSSKNKKPQEISTPWNDTRLLTYTKNNDLLAVGSNNKIWLLEGEEFTQISDDLSHVNAFTLDETHDYVFAAQENGHLVRYSLRDSTQQPIVISRSSTPLYAVKFIKRGKTSYLAAGSEDGQITVINWGFSFDFRLETTKHAHNARINQIAFNNGTGPVSMATASFDKTVRIWNPQNMEQPPIILNDNEDWMWSIAFSPDNSNLWAGSRDYRIKTWPTQTKDMALELCNLLEGDYLLDSNEWDRYVGEDIIQSDTTFCTLNK